MDSRRLLLVAAVSCAALLGGHQPSADAKTTWLCKPGLKDNPCLPGLSTTLVSPAGQIQGTEKVARVKSPKADCFYVYPTVSDQEKPQATFRIDPEQRSIALYQAARYSRDCRVFAPMYRQITLRGLLQPEKVSKRMRERAYADVRNAWRDYLKTHNRGRGVVLISHSQGTSVLRKLVAEEIDGKPSVSKRLISAVLLGGQVLVRKGKDVGGDFKNIRACRSSKQLGCVIAFSTFNGRVPGKAVFGRPTSSRPGQPKPPAGSQVLCTNPAALRGGAARVTPMVPSEPFAPGTTIGALVPQTGFVAPEVSTAWIAAPGSYMARCSTAAGASVLQISSVRGAPKLKALPDATWGLHLADANIALGDLADLVRDQIARFTK